jgi:putative FmdB family regulatory protein
MPIYTYQCENCGLRFERQQSFSEQPLTRCPECNKKALRKVYTPVGIVFKGSGFYSTDHKSPSGGRNPTKPQETKTDNNSSTTATPASSDGSSKDNS